MLPINVPQEKMVILANTFGCQIGSLPFTYLGLPMGTTKPRMEDLTPLMDRIERQLSACSSLLSYSGRLEMVNTVLTSTATYAMCSIKLPKGVIHNIDRARKQCLWRGGTEPTKRGGNLAAWPLVSKPKDKDGLGVINRLQNDALLLKHLHKFYNKVEVPWVQLIWNKYYTNKVAHASREVGSFWWKDIQPLSTIFRGIARCTLGDGSSVLFWDDLWFEDVIAQRFPRLTSFASDRRISVKDAMRAESLDDLLLLPLSQEAFEELQQLNVLLQSQSYEDDSKDIWIYQWGNGTYSSRRLYKRAFQNVATHPIFSWIWKSRCTPCVKFFAWLTLVDRLNTKTMLQRRNLFSEENAHCVMCTEGIDEDIDHLFFRYSFSRRCWQRIGIHWNEDLSILPRIVHARSQQNLPFFMEAVLIAAWEIWKMRNDKVLNNGRVRVNIWFSNFKNQCLL